MSKAMRKGGTLAAVVACAIILSAQPCYAAAKDHKEENEAATHLAALQKTVQQLAVAAQTANLPEFDRLATILVDDPVFDSLPASFRLNLLGALVQTKLQLKNPAAAYTYAVRATAIEGATDADWQRRLWIEISGGRLEAALATIETLVDGHSAVLDAMPADVLYAFDDKARLTGNSAVRLRLLEILSSDRYHPQALTPIADIFRERFASVLYDNGERARAAEIVHQITDAATLIRVSADTRLAPSLAPDFDPRKAVENSLARYRELASANPDSLNAVLQTAALLRRLARFNEALALLEANRPDIPRASPFKNSDEMTLWWWDMLAKVNFELGRYDEGVADFRKAIEIGEQGLPNVSQAINLADMQTRFGHPLDALETLKPLAGPSNASEYGQMMYRINHGCASAFAGKIEEAKTDLVYMRAHQDVAPLSVANLLLCVNDIDAAAAIYIDQLTRPQTRSAALLRLSDFKVNSKVPAYPNSPQEAKLRLRPDMVAAIAQAGGTRQFNLVEIEY